MKLTKEMTSALNRRRNAAGSRVAGRRKAPRTKPYNAKAALLMQIKAAGLPMPTLEHKFHLTRNWRLDFAWPAPIRHYAEADCVGYGPMVAIELEGGVFVKGRHTQGVGMTEDIVKYNEATLAGWVLLRCTPAQVKAGVVIDWLMRALA